MPNFQYKATTSEGEIISGQREGGDKQAVISWLQDSDYIPINVEQVAAAGTGLNRSFSLLGSNQLTKAQVLEMTEQLSTLIRSKLPLDHALKILQKISQHDKVKNLIGNLV